MAARKDGKQGHKADKLWADALRVAVLRQVRKGQPTKRLAQMAETVAKKALDGDMAAIKEIGDRLDGKPAQVVAGDQNKPMRLVIEYIDPTLEKIGGTD